MDSKSNNLHNAIILCTKHLKDTINKIDDYQDDLAKLDDSNPESKEIKEHILKAIEREKVFFKTYDYLLDELKSYE